jgi:hypothetical protein
MRLDRLGIVCLSAGLLQGAENVEDAITDVGGSPH